MAGEIFARQGDREGAARLEDAADLAECGVQIRDMLKDAIADDGAERVIGKGHDGGAGHREIVVNVGAPLRRLGQIAPP